MLLICNPWKEAQKVCKQNIPVVKTIRLCSMEQLRNLLSGKDLSTIFSESEISRLTKNRLHWITVAKAFKEPDLDPYIILLVRDPRGTFNSRAKIFTSNKYIQQGRGKNYDELAHSIGILCNQTRTMLDRIRQWPDLRANTLTVRYEDLASDPLKQDGAY